MEDSKKDNKKVHKLFLNEDGDLVISSSKILSTFLTKYNGSFNIKTNEWTVDIGYYTEIINYIKTNKILYTSFPDELYSFIMNNKSNGKMNVSGGLDFYLSSKISPVYAYLLPFQRESVNFALNRNGRVILADDMGLGKSIQALAIAEYYKKEYPLLIIAPSSLLDGWKDTIKNFLNKEAIVIRRLVDMENIKIHVDKNIKTHVDKNKVDNNSYNKKDNNKVYNINNNIHVDNTNNNNNSNIVVGEGEISSFSMTSFDSSDINNFSISDEDILNEINLIESNKIIDNNIIYITSYDMASKGIKHITGIKAVIVDECHALKDMNAQRTKNLLPFLSTVNRLILVSGTPALSKPIELYTLIKMLNSKIYKNMKIYGDRYCLNNKYNYNKFYSKKQYYNGCTNAAELKYVLSLFMVRRIKEEVLHQLPKKTRKQEVITNIPKDNLYEENTDIMKMYYDSALKKLNGVIEYVEKLLNLKRKFLIFAHHESMLNGIENKIKDKTMYIRIDGSTPSILRQGLVHKFNNTEEYKIALLSITSASTGLNLTSANLVLFAELYWNPGNLLQAEDRVHRIGQKSEVEIIYLLGENTVDEKVWPKILNKLNTLEKLGINKNKLKSVEKKSNNNLNRYFNK
ncbi:SWF/SNF family helicase [Spraguea lophii 42_110]|uniref:SWF/SNF family helicase n=1 Tax=Spraguea lophii (strain 42_110) TaxID=1358809 RepID=S7W7M6_SPRLO|nr:SWF/SNF family helicase [Spraguea lophii 42_110]